MWSFDGRKTALVCAGAAAMTMALATLGPSDVRAELSLSGEWPVDDKTVTIDLSGATRAEALKKLAKEAGFSVIMPDMGADRVDVKVQDQPAGKVLGVLLGDGNWVAHRDGSLVSISRGSAAIATASPSAIAVPDVPPVPSVAAVAADDAQEDGEDAERRAKKSKSRDVQIFGNSLRIGKDEVVRDVTVMGGSVVIEGQVTGDLAVFGGKAHLTSTAHVEGDATATGGQIKIDEGARIDGDLGAIGGNIDGAEHAKVGGSTVMGARSDDEDEKLSVFVRAGRSISDGIRSAALLFVLGAVFIALGGARVESLRAEIAARPMRSAALGLVGLIGSIIAFTVLCVTVIGIPFALVGALLALIAAVAGITSALTVAGAMIAGHKSPNVYVHLAVGCVIFFIAGLVPFIGGLGQAVIIFAGLGAVVATRAGGLLNKRGQRDSSHPYRS